MEKGTFLRKRPEKFNPTIQSLLIVLHRNKALHNFCAMGKRSIVEWNIDLEYVLVCLLIFHFIVRSTFLEY